MSPDTSEVLALLRDLRGKGVRVWAQGSSLEYSTPNGARDKSIRETLDAIAPQVLNLKVAGVGFDKVDDRLSIRDVLPLHPAQHLLWAQQVSLTGRSLNCSYAYALQGSVDVRRLVECYTQVLRRTSPMRLFPETSDQAWRVDRRNGAEVSVENVPDGEGWEGALARAREKVLADLNRGGYRPGCVTILRTGGSEYLVVEVFNHIVCDGKSLGLLHSRVEREYAGANTGVADQGYLRLLAHADGRAVRREAMVFWKDMFSGFVSPSEPEWAPVSAARRCSFRLEGSVVRSAAAAAARSAATFPALLFAAYAHVCARYNGTFDVVCLHVMDSRGPAELDCFGQFARLVPIRIRHDWSVSIGEHVGAIARLVARARDLLCVSPEEMRECGAPIALDYSGSCVFLAQDPQCAPVLHSCSSSGVEMPNKYRAGGILLKSESSAGDSVLLTFEVGSQSRWGAVVEQFAAATEAFFRAFAADDGISLGADSLLPAADRRLINDLARPEPAFPFEPVDRQITRGLRGHDRAVFVDSGHHCNASTLRTIIANKLQQLRRLGIGPDDVVSVAEPRTIDRIACFVAVLRLGAVYVPVSSLSHPAIGPFLDRFGTAAFDAGALSRRGGKGSRGSAGRTMRRQPESAAYYIMTSGTSGIPKVTAVPHRALSNLISGEADRFGLDSRARVLLIAPPNLDPWICHVAATLSAGGTLVHVDHSDEPDLTGALQSHGVTHAFLPPSLLELLEPERLPKLRVLASAGDHCRPEHVERWCTGSRSFWNIYGPTEVAVTSTVARVSGPSGPISIGRPIRGLWARILLDGRVAVPVGVPGELFIGGIGVGLGYVDDADATAHQFREIADGLDDRMYATGDIATIGTDGNLYIRGRSDRQVKVRGIRVSLDEVEAAARACHSDGDVCVGMYASGGGQRDSIVLYVEACEDPASLRKAMRRRGPSYIVPKAIVPVDQLPRTHSGKVDQAGLPSPVAASEVPAGGGGNSPADVLLRIWRSEFGPGVRDSDNFFDLGGDSLSVLRFTRDARGAGLHMSPGDVYQNPVLSNLARAICAEKVLVRRDHVAATDTMAAAQHWFASLGLPPSRAWYQSRAFRVEAGTEEDQIAAAVDALIDETPVLRSRFDLKRRRCEIRSERPGRRHTRLTYDNEPGSRDAFRRHLSGVLDRMDPTTGEVFQALIVRSQKGELAVVLVAHHLVVDVWSWLVIERRLRQKLVVSDPDAAPDTGFFQYAELLTAQVKTGAHDEDAAVWEGVLGSGRTGVALTWFRHTEYESVYLDATLRSIAQDIGTSGAAVALACLGHGLHRIEPDGRSIVDLERNGRSVASTLDLSESVGWFGSHHPIPVDHAESIVVSAHRIQEFLDSTSDQGSSYGLLRWGVRPLISSDRVGRFAVNILSVPREQVGGSSFVSALERALERDPASDPFTLPHHGAFTFVDNGRSTVVSCEFDDRGLSGESVRYVLDEMVQAVRRYKAGSPIYPARRQPDATSFSRRRVRLSCMQHLMVHAAEISRGRGVYCPEQIVELDVADADLDQILGALGIALGGLSPFRTRFLHRSSRWLQYREDDKPIDIPNMRGGLEEARSWLREHRYLGFPDVASECPLFQMASFTRDREPLRLVMQFHHAVVDGVTNRHLLRTIDKCLRGEPGPRDDSWPYTKHVASERAGIVDWLAPQRTESGSAVDPSGDTCVSRSLQPGLVRAIRAYCHEHRIDIRSACMGSALACSHRWLDGHPVFAVTNGRPAEFDDSEQWLGMFWYFQRVSPSGASAQEESKRFFATGSAILSKVRSEALAGWRSWLSTPGVAFNFHQFGDGPEDRSIRVRETRDLFHFPMQVSVSVSPSDEGRVAIRTSARCLLEANELTDRYIETLRGLFR